MPCSSLWYRTTSSLSTVLDLCCGPFSVCVPASPPRSTLHCTDRCFLFLHACRHSKIAEKRHHLPRTNRQPPLRRPIAWALIVGGSLQVFTSLATRTAFVPSGSPVSMLLPRPTPTRRTLHLTQDVESFARSYVLQAGVCAREEERLVNLKVRCLLVGCRLHLKVALVGLDRRCLLRPAFHPGVFFCCFLGS